MSNQTTFSAEEWALIRGAPHMVAMAVASTGGGVVGAMKEAFSAAQIMATSANNSNELIRSICATDEIKAAEAALRDLVMKNPAQAVETLRNEAIKDTEHSLMILAQKSPDDIDAYGSFILQIAQTVAQAAKEGGFLGFGGKRVSDAETEILNTLQSTIEAKRPIG